MVRARAGHLNPPIKGSWLHKKRLWAGTGARSALEMYSLSAELDNCYRNSIIKQDSSKLGALMM